MSSSGHHTDTVRHFVGLYVLVYSSCLIIPGNLGNLGNLGSAPATRPAAPVAEHARLVTAVTARLPVADSASRPTLQRGSRGHWVRVVQRELGVPVDGIYGPVTEGAVMDFQRRRGLVVDGIVGPRTWAALDGRPDRSGKGSEEGVTGDVAAAVNYARTQVGDSYTYGGDGPDSFDCSGLTMMALRQAGVSLPHSSQGQARHGTPTSWSQLKRGDLVFFYEPISHVGIYVGGGKMVAASNPEDGVELINLRGSYWHGRFTTARRMIQRP